MSDDTTVRRDTSGAPLVEARGLTVRAGRTDVLRDVSFTLRRGQILGLIGESGAGKSMIGRVVADQLPPGFRVAGGALRFGSFDLLSLPHATHARLLGREIAFIPQEPSSALNPSMTIGQHFRGHLSRLGFQSTLAEAMALASLNDVRIAAPEVVLDQYPFQLSGGMCQRVLIALAFASKPDLVIADEPTASLDVTTQRHIVGLMKNLQAHHGSAVLFITHQLRLAAQICDQIAVLYAGEVVELGGARQVLSSPRHPYTGALKSSTPSFEGVWVPLTSLRGQMPGLSDYDSMRGCRFAPRCSSAEDECSSRTPQLREQTDGVVMRCIKTDARADLTEGPPPSRAMHLDAAPMLAVEHVTKVFRSGKWLSRASASWAVKDVGFTVAPGEFVGIVGESGSGKSTLARLIMGLEKPTAGRIVLDEGALGFDGDEWRRRIAGIQLVFQDPRAALNPRRKLLDLVTQPMEGVRASRAMKLERARDLLTVTGLPVGLLNKFSSDMSGGQRQRVNIARALCATPRLLVADEITSGLDVSVQAQILNLLLTLRDQFDIALLMISHDLAVVRYLCSRVLVMRKGEVVEAGLTSDVFDRPTHPYTRELISAMPPEDMKQAWATSDPAEVA